MAQARIGGQGVGVELWEPAPQVQGVDTPGQSLVGHRIEWSQIGAAADQQLEVLLVPEGKGRAAGHPDGDPARRRAAVGVRAPRLHRHRRGGRRQRHHVLEFELSLHQRLRRRDDALGRSRVLGGRHQAQVALLLGQAPVLANRAQDGHADRL